MNANTTDQNAAVCSDHTNARRYAALPDAARGPVITEKGYHVQDVGNGVYWVTAGYYDTMFLTTGQGVIAIDAPPALGANMLAAIAEVTNEPVTHVVYSHWHADHIGAAGIYDNSVVRIAHQITNDQLARFPDPERPLPTVTFDTSYTLRVGDKTLLLDYKGNAHEPGNIFIHAPEQKTLMLVDIIFPGWIPFRNLAMADDIAGYLQAHDQLLEYDFDTYIGGHLNRFGNREDVLTQREYMHDLRDFAIEALNTVQLQEIAQEVGVENAWVFFDAYMNAVIQHTTEGVLAKITSNGKKWTERLGGADVWTIHHAFEMVQARRLEAPHAYSQERKVWMPR